MKHVACLEESTFRPSLSFCFRVSFLVALSPNSSPFRFTDPAPVSFRRPSEKMGYHKSESKFAKKDESEEDYDDDDDEDHMPEDEDDYIELSCEGYRILPIRRVIDSYENTVCRHCIDLTPPLRTTIMREEVTYGIATEMPNRNTARKVQRTPGKSLRIGVKRASGSVYNYRKRHSQSITG
jgi:hypothetical protein